MSADANTTAIAIAPETSFGVLPGTPSFTALRLTGEDIGHTKDTVISEEIRDDRQVPDMVKVGSQAIGGINVELSRDEYLTLFEALLCGTWTTTTVSAVSGDISASGSTFTATTPGDLADVPVGGFVKVTGATNPLNNGFKRVVSNDGDVVTFSAGSFVANQTGVSLDIVATQVKNGTVQRSFTVERQIVTDQTADFFQRYVGMKVGQANFAIESKKIITGRFEFLGKYGVTSANSIATAGVEATNVLTFAANPTAGDTCTIGGITYTFVASPAAAYDVDIGADASGSLDNLIAAINGAAGEGTTYGTDTEAHPTVSAAAGAGDTMDLTARTAGTGGNLIGCTETFTNAGNVFTSATLTGGTSSIYTAATSNPILNGTSNVGSFDGPTSTLTEKFKMLNFAVNNNLRGKDAIGEEGNFEVGLGTFSVSGRVSAYFKDNTLYQSLIAHDDTALHILLVDDDGDGIGFSWPRVKFGTGNPNATGINTDIMLDIDFTAIRDAVTDATMIISRLNA